ncbi:NAD(P) transhydrogenase subunit alpha [Rhodoligotrophos appendicifer]|uniref:Re/Si-specific NAD(P)(+) transhydrogenase subunit alpha n=1 Tax=Rhodoligotrophos appendicifer TaxID=987056 RepID=UPI001185F933|nr:Re/Si-specific NAD(P)(+) transhydrogenase subunit alpha [Rhodoligotrophos appendicifer]
MKLAVLAEGASGETRVAAVPDSVKALVKKGLDVVIVTGAGAGSFFSDAAYEAAGARIAGSNAEAVQDADIVLAVRRPPPDLVPSLKSGAVVVGQLDPYGAREELDALARQNTIAFAMELMPRITRAQSMDVLSSQANLAGYKAVVDAAAAFGRALPMMMTAAGTVPAARAFIMGAGVAGLQAIATARRLGAVVTATDVRRAAAEQVQSLGAKFVMVEADGEDLETKGGYAKEMSEDYKRRQEALVAEHVKTQDIVITTALIPGRPAPRLITAAMVESMKPGSIIVDLAAERGGNVELAKPGEVVNHNGVTIMGHLNLAGRIAGNASPLYAKNLLNFLDVIVKDGVLAIDWNDDIIKGTALTRDGQLVHPALLS